MTAASIALIAGAEQLAVQFTGCMFPGLKLINVNALAIMCGGARFALALPSTVKPLVGGGTWTVKQRQQKK